MALDLHKYIIFNSQFMTDESVIAIVKDAGHTGLQHWISFGRYHFIVI